VSSHKKPPRWYGQAYANLAGWDKAVKQCRDLLEAWARRGYVGTYSEVARAVTAIAWPDGPHTHEGSQIGTLLGEVAVGEWFQDRPLLSAIVVQAGMGLPGKGFYNLGDELGLLPTRNEDLDQIFWANERERCLKYWRNAP
jgi:hypothetical protein